MENRLALYYQLADKILKKIESGEYKPKDKLPTERELCEKQGVSRATVRQAFLYLEQKGYIYKVQGRGTFVSPRIVEQSLLEFYSFSAEMKKQGREPRSEIVAFKKIVAPLEILGDMDIQEGEEVFELKRIMFADNEPMMYEKTYLPLDRFEGLTREKLANTSMYDLLIREYQVKFERADESFQPIKLSEQEAAYLHTDTDEPSMKIKRKTYEGDRCIEVSISVTRNKFKYKITLKK